MIDYIVANPLLVAVFLPFGIFLVTGMLAYAHTARGWRAEDRGLVGQAQEYRNSRNAYIICAIAALGISVGLAFFLGALR